jgi:hypothetical protein
MNLFGKESEYQVKIDSNEGEERYSITAESPEEAAEEAVRESWEQKWPLSSYDGKVEVGEEVYEFMAEYDHADGSNAERRDIDINRLLEE